MTGEPRRTIVHRLEIFVANGCGTCSTARDMAITVTRWNVRNLHVEVVDLDQPGAVRPASVFAVPTYLLDGAVISLGNPTAEEIRERLSQAVGVGPCQ